MEAKNTLLFVAAFEDGHLIHQTHDDTSSLTEGGNCFTDVQTYEKQSPLVSFGLLNEDKTASYVVDLSDGHFEINSPSLNQVFWQHRRSQNDYENFRVIYYRVTQINANVHVATGNVIGSNMTVGGYVIGWQVTHEGKNVQRIIRI